MKCPICYSGVPDESEYCPICGNKLAEQKSETFVPNTTQPVVEPKAQVVASSVDNSGTYTESNAFQQVPPQQAPQTPSFYSPAPEATYADYAQEPQTQNISFTAEEMKQGKVVAILMYFIPILFLIPLISEKYKTPYYKKHSNQVFVLWIFNFFTSIIRTILMAAVSDSSLSNTVAGIVTMLFLGITIFTIVLYIIGIVQAANCTRKDLPVLGKIHIFDK